MDDYYGGKGDHSMNHSINYERRDTDVSEGKRILGKKNFSSV